MNSQSNIDRNDITEQISLSPKMDQEVILRKKEVFHV